MVDVRGMAKKFSENEDLLQETEESPSKQVAMNDDFPCVWSSLSIGETKAVGNGPVGFECQDEAFSERLTVREPFAHGWGPKGYVTMPCAHPLTVNLSSNFWTIRFAENSFSSTPTPTQ